MIDYDQVRASIKLQQRRALEHLSVDKSENFPKHKIHDDIRTLVTCHQALEALEAFEEEME